MKKNSENVSFLYNVHWLKMMINMLQCIERTLLYLKMIVHDLDFKMQDIQKCQQFCCDIVKMKQLLSSIGQNFFNESCLKIKDGEAINMECNFENLCFEDQLCDDKEFKKKINICFCRGNRKGKNRNRGGIRVCSSMRRCLFKNQKCIPVKRNRILQKIVGMYI